MKKIYLDYAASTPTHKDVLKVMEPYFSTYYGNPGSLHSFGQEALAALDGSREIIAEALGVQFGEIIFTGSATEANNLALRGVIAGLPKDFVSHYKPRIITSSIEHESILETCRVLEDLGVEVVYLPVDTSGVIKLSALRSNLNERTVLVSLMYANNHIGSIQPLQKAAEIIAEFRKPQHSLLHNLHYPFFHTDAVQALQFIDCNTTYLGVDLMSLSSQKIYGPKGAGILYRNKNIPLSPIITGGSQEKGIRAGTENIPAIVGFAKALQLILKNQEREASRIRELRDFLYKGILKIQPKAQLNGPELSGRKPSPELRLPNNLHIYFPGKKSQDLIIAFDLQGLAVSSGSACSVRTATSSYVVGALGFSEERAAQSIRITLGRPTTRQEISAVLAQMRRVVK
ncbi:MAG: hypothetical protein A3H06_00010 [Candidatus Colwellbacteria bacterium RIFCSPLOWO2_12_FULL_44_13]|uniref:cysteine desulfurase n=2 Tax=Candidatus Colwelliibacteriota TaxID=1817904 RepID=A0A1G1Z725_9BACT|nr:MAG: hypothetical protein A3I31_02895 [Candidatus Colwellbacteria bacterium RIFCSPLOWO2_02_FULL_44_20b]OGY61500.1 MAG: hypothetical protein A3H06_00010 [Candidatus Colwellbacteria bacterium RIFCSPLOWO2_12_FULL_44_13]